MAPLYLEIFTTSLGALLLEIAYTRIFSFKVFYYFTYLILGAGLLGIGAGGIALAVSGRLRAVDLRRLVPVASIGAGASVLVGYLVIAPMPIDIAQSLGDPVELAKLVFVSLLLTLSFSCIGLALSAILSSRPDAASRLYGADLLGAALGCALAVPLLSWLDPPRTVMLAGLVLAAGGLRLARASRPLLLAGAVVTLALALPIAAGDLLPDPVVAANKRFEEFRRNQTIRYSHWSPVFRVDVADNFLSPGDVYLVFHDGQPGSGLRRLDPDFRQFAHLPHDSRALPFDALPPQPRVLVIGAAGGHEVVASLYFGASHVTGVELNPVTYSLLTDVYADLTGHLDRNPRVTLVNGDGRWYLKQSQERYDLIWLVAPDSYAAMNASTSGAFVLSESYLYTVEMVREGLRHLAPRGLVCAQFGEVDFQRKPNRTTRYLATARAAFTEAGIGNFGSHVIVSRAPGYPPFSESTVLLGRAPFAAWQKQALHRRVDAIEGARLVWVPGRPIGATPVEQVINLDDAAVSLWYQSYPYRVDPVRDDSPFFWHFARFRDAAASALPSSIVDYEDTIAEQVMLGFLGVLTILAAALLLLPLVAIRPVWRALPHKSGAALYFGALGLGFMFIEVGLIQKLTLLLGYPTYSLSVTLFALLSSSGAGSLWSGRRAARRNRTLLVTFACLAALVIAAHVGLPGLIDRVVGRPLALRVALAALLITPLGLCLGAFLPLGLRTVAAASPHSREYVAWAWAVNGFFSVIASILATMLAMGMGFDRLMLVSLAVYAAGALALARFPEPAAG